jgi:methionyl-tRNA synthetase
VIISTYEATDLHAALGIEMGAIEQAATAASWARVAPGRRTDPDRHDESEVWVIVAGAGDVVVDAGRHRVTAGTVIAYDPFETHVIENTGDTDLVFVTFYWRDGDRALAAAGRRDARRFGERPLFVFSTPPTPNGDLHLGHLSGPYLGADAYVRYQRMNGARAWHLTGSDDFQSYVLGAARREGHGPAETAAHYSAEIAETLRLMDIVPDQYTVTNGDESYPPGLRAFFSRVAASGEVTAREAPALFAPESGEYVYEGDVRGGCPGCGESTGGNICEECGEPNLCTDLIDPHLTTARKPPERRTVRRFTLPLHEFAGAIAEHHSVGRVPARLRELADRVFRRDELDIPVTHPSRWGVPPREDDVDGQVIWVWPEMAYGFLHGIETLGRLVGEDWRSDAPDPEWKIVHFFGYDNSFYHAILYPALYRLAHPEWRPDIDYNVNEFYLLDGQKFSTSRRHAVWGKEILSPESVDAVRFFLARTRPEGRRTNFTRDAYAAVLRDTLIGTWQTWLNDLGGRIVERHDGRAPDAGVWTPEHTAFLDRLGVRRTALAGALGPDGFSLNRAADELNGIVEDTLAFARLEAPAGRIDRWSSQARSAVALELAAARLLARCAMPVMPRFAARLAGALGDPAPTRWPDGVELVPPGTVVELSKQVFFTPDPAGAVRGEPSR